MDHKPDPALMFGVITMTPPQMTECVMDSSLSTRLAFPIQLSPRLSCVNLGKFQDFSELQVLLVKIHFMISYRKGPEGLFLPVSLSSSCLFLVPLHPFGKVLSTRPGLCLGK